MTTAPPEHDAANPHHRPRWRILAVLCVAQLMVVLDATIVNIALPSAQASLGFSNGNRQWIITSYALAFGSLLLLGGRISDTFGRKWTFIGGLCGFAAASAVGGTAQSFDVLVAARAAQGVFGALLAPAALSLLTTTFTDDGERAKAFGVYSAIAGGGSALGLLLGGALTEYLTWRWCLYVNLALAIPAATAGAVLLGSKEAGSKHGLKPRAKIRAFVNIGSEPAMMLTGPVDVTKKLFERSGMKKSDIDLFELNEAFASVVLRYMQAFDIDNAVINVNGGAIALGHPLGATGAMILGTVLDELERTNKSTALVTLCIGGGMGTATIIERV